MYQLTLNLDNQFKSWIDKVYGLMTKKLSAFSAVCISQTLNGRIYLSFACENTEKVQVLACIKTFLKQIYMIYAKIDYFKNNLHLGLLNNRFKSILFKTLLSFDRQYETDVLNEILKIGDGLSIDGFLYFKLKNMTNRWKEIVDLTNDNLKYLLNELSFYEFIRFLLDSSVAKLETVELIESNLKYSLVGMLHYKPFILKDLNDDEVIYHLINFAPRTVELIGELRDKNLYADLTNIFDIKNSVL